MANVSLTANIRQSLLSLQDTASLQALTNNHLSTGKKVSSALDNPVNFFTAQALDNRSSSLSGLLDGMANGIQTIQAANKGITSLTSMMQQLQSLVKTARQDATNVTLGTAVVKDNTATGNSKSLSFALADGSTVGIPLTSSTGTSYSKQAVINSINNNATLSANVQASLDSVTGNIKLQNKTGADITVTGVAAGGFDGSATTATLTAGVVTMSDVRKNAANQFNDLLAQVDKIAKDSGFNGTNLLGGDAVKVVFNEKTGNGQSSVTVKSKNADGTDFGAMSYTSLGLTTASATADGSNADWSLNAKLDNYSDAITNALSTLQTQSAQFGTALALTQTRQDFTKNIIDVLKTGSSNLTDADMNEEAANSQSLATRNSLGISALSLANQSAQAVLQLLR